MRVGGAFRLPEGPRDVSGFVKNISEAFKKPKHSGINNPVSINDANIISLGLYGVASAVRYTFGATREGGSNTV
ncbi:hypothetical protein L6452_32134 [Arctium lappa]|uniref:Uncharacterized protein n=1 Tax=Arctium lappa TaxID=4217 RepID=A0ACB8Z7Z3_ARCLA|nr:hypothetical protein L6452_32134 [Arctium lappa]